jgi:toxin HigB-1
MISSFKHKGLREFFETKSKRGIPPELSGRLRDRLDVIDAAATLEDIALPHFGLHELKGDRAATWCEGQQELARDLCFCGRRG